jgi:hypothetical protein
MERVDSRMKRGLATKCRREATTQRKVRIGGCEMEGALHVDKIVHDPDAKGKPL